MFNKEQEQYLVGALGQGLFTALVSAAAVGAQEALRPLIAAKLEPGEVDMVLADAGKGETKKGYAAASGTAVVVSGKGKVDASTQMFSNAIAAALTSRDRNGLVKFLHKGVRGEYLDGTQSWPTQDAFGRPFPSIETIAGMKTENMKQCITTSGWPKVKVDEQFYMVTDRGTDPAKADQTMYFSAGDRIAPYAWRGYNMKQGGAARFWLAQHHEARCAADGIEPKEYRAILVAKAASAAAVPTGIKPTRSRRVKV